MAGTLTIDTIQTGTGTYISTANIAKGIARAWVNFNGDSGVVIRSSFNVTSVVRNALGDYTINFTTPMADANYVGILAGSSQNGRVYWNYSGGSTNNGSTPVVNTTNSFRLICGNTTTTPAILTDSTNVYAVFYGN